MGGPMPSSRVSPRNILEDPRVDRIQQHNLTDICSTDSFVALVLFGQLSEEWLRTFVALPNGIPAHDTLGRVFARLDADRFEESFRDWMQDTINPTDGQIVSGSQDRGSGTGFPASGEHLGPRPTGWCWPRRR